LLSLRARAHAEDRPGRCSRSSRRRCNHGGAGASATPDAAPPTTGAARAQGKPYAFRGWVTDQRQVEPAGDVAIVLRRACQERSRGRGCRGGRQGANRGRAALRGASAARACTGRPDQQARDFAREPCPRPAPTDPLLRRGTYPPPWRSSEVRLQAPCPAPQWRGPWLSGSSRSNATPTAPSTRAEGGNGTVEANRGRRRSS
jgi:hypothetical protein